MISDTVYLGITASMNQYKSVTIQNLKLYEIIDGSPEVNLNPKNNYIVGSPVNFIVNLASLCQMSLWVYPTSYMNLIVKINDNIYNKTNINYVQSIRKLNVSVLDLKSTGNFKFDILWKNKKLFTKFLDLIPTSRNYLNVCEPKYDRSTGEILLKELPNKEFVNIKICSVDEFGNKKRYDYQNPDDLVYVEYPNLISPLDKDLEIKGYNDNSEFNVKIPIISTGKFTLFNKLFHDQYLSFTIKSTGISDYYSTAVIKDFSFFNISSDVFLLLSLKDSFSNNLDINMLTSMNCTPKDSTIKIESQTDIYENLLDSNFIFQDDKVMLKYTPLVSGTFTFKPKINCGNSVEIKCSLCTFTIANGEFNDKVFKIYSDFFMQYKDTLSITKTNPIYVSLHEDGNKKITEMLFLDKSLIQIIPSNDPTRFNGYLNGTTVNIVKYRNDNTIESSVALNPILNLATGIEFYTMPNETKKRSELFSPILSYKLEIKIPAITSTPLLSLDISFVYEDDFLNNISTLNTSPNETNFLALWIPETKVIKASTNVNTFRILARNSDGNLIMGDTMDPSNLSVLFYPIDKPDSQINVFTVDVKKIGIFLYVYTKLHIAGKYTVKVGYSKTNPKQNIIANFPISVEARSNVYSLDYEYLDANTVLIDKKENTSDTIQTITLKNQSLGSSFSLRFRMKDLFGNIIINNFISVYNSISIINNSKAKLSASIDGAFTLTSQENYGSYSVTLTLLTGNQYIINWNVTSDFSAISNNDLFVDIIGNPIIDAGNSVLVNINYKWISLLNQDDRNVLERNLKDSLQIYAKSNKNLIPLTFMRNNTSIYFISDKINVSDEYEIKAFKDDLPIRCGYCHFVINPLNIIDRLKPFLVDDGELLPLHENYSQIINLPAGSQKFPSFFFKKLDKFGNEIYIKSSNLTAYIQPERIGQLNISLCPINYSLNYIPKREYVEICSRETSKLVNGSYILYDSFSRKYRLLVSSNPIGDSKTPDKSKSFIQNDNLNIIYSSVDAEAIIVVDIRDETNKRTISLSKNFTISGLDVPITVLRNSPRKGLYSIIFSIGKKISLSDNVKISINYENNSIIENILIVNNPGTLSKISYTQKQKVIDNKYYFQFKLEDQVKAVPSLMDKNIYHKNYFYSLLNVANDKGLYISFDYSLNDFSGIYTIIVDAGPTMTSVMKFLYGLPGLVTQIEQANIIIGNPDPSKSFAVIKENEANLLPGGNASINFYLYDSNGININLGPKTADLNLYINVLVGDTVSNTYYYLETKKFNYSKADVNPTFNYTYPTPGDYIFIPKLENTEISCLKCRLIVKIKPNDITLNNSKLFIKDEIVGWKDINPSEPINIFLNSFPFFKLVIKDSFGITTRLNSLNNYTFNLSTIDGKKMLGLNVFQTNSNGILIYLTNADRNTWLTLNSPSNMKLSITDKNNPSNKIEFSNFFILKANMNMEKTYICKDPPSLVFESRDVENIFIRSGNDYIVNFSIQRCKVKSQEYVDQSSIQLAFSDSTVQSLYNYILIPAEKYGTYCAVISSKKARIDTARFIYNNVNSPILTFNIIPNSLPSQYTIFSDSFSALDDIGTFEFEVRDINMNSISREHSLFLYNDIYLNITYNNMPVNYKITYSPSKQAYIAKFDIQGQGDYLILPPSSNDNKVITVKAGSLSKNSYFNYTSSTQSYIISIFQLDLKYNQISSNIDLSQWIISYNSFDPITKTMKSVNLNNNLVKLDSNKIEISKTFTNGTIGFFSIGLKSTDEYIIPVGQQFINYNTLYSFLSNGQLFNFVDRESNFFIDSGSDLPVFRSGIVNTLLELSYKKNNFNGEMAIAYTPCVIGQATYFSNNSTICNGCNNLYLVLKLIDNSLTTPYQSIQVNYVSSNATQSDIDVTKLNLIGMYGPNLRFYVNEPGLFFVKARDINGNPVVKTPKLGINSNSSGLMINVISSYVSGVYLIEIQNFLNSIFKNTFSITNGKTESPVIINANIIATFPIRIDLQEQVIKNGMVVKYPLIATDIFNNTLCDHRLNVKISNQILLNSRIYYNSLTNSCLMEVKFLGSATIENIYNYTKSFTNIEDIPSVDYFNSFVITSENNLVSVNKANATLQVVLVSPLNNIYDTSLSTKIEVKIYRILDLNLRLLVKSSIDCTFNCKFSPSPSQYGDYLISTIVNGVELASYTSIKYSRSIKPTPSSFKVYKFPSLDEVTSLLDFNNSIKFDNFTEGLDYPFNYRISIVNEDNEIIPILDNVSIIFNIRAYNKGFTDIIALSINAMCISQTKCLVTLPKDKITSFLHMPQGNYVIEFIVTGGRINYKKVMPILINSKKNYQFSNLAYSNELDTLPSNIDIMGVGQSASLISTNLNYFIKKQICIVNNIIDKIVYNNYLDPTLLKIGSSNFQGACNVIFSIRYRGCFDFSIKCNTYPSQGTDQYNLNLSYNNQNLKTTLLINLDPEFPPKSSLILSSFPNNTIQNSQIISNFSLSDGNNNLFKFVEKEDLRVLLNSYFLSKEMWSFSTNNGVSTITISAKYPPKINTLKVYYDTDKSMVLLSNLTQNFSISQGDVNYKNAKISIQAGVKAGQVFKINLIIPDSYNNCFEDKINTDLINVTISNDKTLVIKNFDITQQKTSYRNCLSYVKVTAINNTVITTPGFYNLSFNYNNSDFNVVKNFYVVNGDIYPPNCIIKVEGLSINLKKILVGNLFIINFQAKDAYLNIVPPELLINRFNIVIPTLTQGQDYNVYYLINENQIDIYLKISVVGIFNISYITYDKELINLPGLNKIMVINGECSNKYPYIKPDKTIWYSGEIVSIKLKCFDDYNFALSDPQNENFKFLIKGNNLSLIGNDLLTANNTFNNGLYTVNFLVIFSGQYDFTVYLNNKNYGDSISLNVVSKICPIKNQIMCSNLTCVNSTKLCKDDINQTCPDEKPFMCKIKGNQTCTNSFVNCDCPDGFVKCRDACILASQMSAYCYDPVPLENCTNVLIGKTNSPIQCPDGSCRFSNNIDCGSPYVCPLKFKKCGVTCIPNNITCNLTMPNCTSNQIICWDMTCASSPLKCPTKKTCYINEKLGYNCPDGRCVENEFYCSQPPTCYEPSPFLCSDFTCAKNIQNCKVKKSCKPGEALCQDNQCHKTCLNKNISICSIDQVTCPNGDCVSNILLCSTEITCQLGQIKCSTGVCVSDTKLCKYTDSPPGINCPLSTPILCQDLSCVNDITSCNQIDTCPPFSSFRCWNNECRKSKELCPTKKKCNANVPILCSDGTCQTAPYNCVNSLIKCLNNQVKCYDGSCVDSYSLCPTFTTCPQNQILCWDNTCANDILNCTSPPSNLCPQNLYMCNDGSCRSKKNLCPTMSVCPIETPIKCYDGTCRKSMYSCPLETSCGENMFPCPDGTCGSQNNPCGTMITCETDTPFKCNDNSCKKDVRDCPVQAKCDNFLCPDGSCVVNRMNCKLYDQCPSTNPIKCQSQICVKEIESCKSLNCPVGYFRCDNGECKANEDLCQKFECPINFPYLCKEGVCVQNENQCDLPNGCPYNLPYKCNDGTCVINKDTCLTINANFKCGSDLKGCPDGSCRELSYNCPLANGCSLDKPQKCADGSCINPTVTVCHSPICPFEKPIKCHSGNCVQSSINCPKSLNENDFKECNSTDLFPNQNLYMCANGRCVKSPDLCRAVFACPQQDFIRCSDNSCNRREFCPKGNNCPLNRNNFCETNGKCVNNLIECDNNCPTNFTLCNFDGLCYEKSDNKSCINPTKSDGCSSPNVKCLDGRCMPSLDECKTIYISCNKTNPYLCQDGTCSKSCSNVTSCSTDMIRCPDNTCVLKSDYFSKCKNANGCELTKPYRCIDGSCSSIQCPISIACPSSAPYKCSDLSCAPSPSFCNFQNLCPTDLPYRCQNNGFCVDNLNKCSSIYKNLCPIASPILCKNGNCVDKIQKCSNIYIKDCPNNQYFCVNSGKCIDTYAECSNLINLSINNKSLTSNLRMLQNDTNSNYSCNFVCYDGLCTNNKEDCPPIPACNLQEIRCPSGLCQSDYNNCKNVIKNNDSNLNLCIDGIYRKDCPDYNGCGSDAPLQCSNGNCVKDMIECIGYSMCEDTNRPYRCFDGSCTSSPNDCEFIYNTINSESITSTVSQYNPVQLEFAYDLNGEIIGSLYIPANSLKMKSSYGQLIIKPVYKSKIKDNYFKNDHNYRLANTILQSDGNSTFETNILSVIVNISITNCSQNFSIPGRMFLQHNSLDYYSNLNFSDICLAKLEQNWVCIQRKIKRDQKFFSFNSTGVYSLLLKPKAYIPKKNLNTETSNIILKNLTLIFIILGCCFLISIIIFYIFTRVFRYRIKYKEKKSELLNLHSQIEEFKNMSTDCPGQTLGDNIAGIIYYRNPSFSVVSCCSSNVEKLEFTIEELQRKCKNTEKNNKILEEKIQELNDQYKQFKFNIEM